MDKTKIKYNVHTFIDSVGELGICVSPVKGENVFDEKLYYYYKNDTLIAILDYFYYDWREEKIKWF